MKKIAIILLCLLPVAVRAQQLTGTVTDKNGHPLDAVTITIKQENKTVASAFADSGRFSIQPLVKGHYTITATLIGYLPATLQLELPKDTIRIMMLQDGKQLKEVIISSSRPVIERKIDRVIFNVESSIVASGGNAWDALIKAPGVQLKSGNDLTANHKNVQVYMDGKPLNLAGDDLSNYLQGLPSDAISQIEVFSNPPAKFEAQGGTVINIISKKVKKEGLNIGLNSSCIQATYGTYSAGGNFNYRKDKLNIYGSYSFTNRKSVVEHNVFIDYGTSNWESPNRSVFISDNHNYRLGADYQLTANQVIGLLVTGNNRTGSTNGFSPTRITSGPGALLDSTLQTYTNGSTGGKRYSYNLNYNLKLDSGKSGLNIDVDYSPFQSHYNAYLDNTSYLPDGSITGNPYNIYTPSSQKIDIYSGKADYNFTVAKKWNFISGVKYSNISSRNTFDYYNTVKGRTVEVPEKGNYFDYHENTIAAYGSTSGAIGKLSIEAGLRVEYTRTKGYSLTLDSLNTNNYLKLFPTLFLQYKLNEQNELQFTYGYRIERPEYARLNPAKHYSSPYSFYVGNPGLQPAFIDNLELGYTYQKQYNITAYYTATHDLFTNVSQQDNTTKEYFDTQQNLGLSMSTGLRLTLPAQPASWWSLNLLAEGFYQREASSYLQSRYDYRQLSYDATLNQTFTINKAIGLKAELASSYNGPGMQGIFKVGDKYRIDAGIKANVLHGNGTIRLAGNDLFYSETYHIRVNYLNQNNGFYHRNDTRNLTVSFTYRFGKNVAASRSRNTSNDDERKRIAQ